MAGSEASHRDEDVRRGTAALVVAAGGGGDALGALVVARTLGLDIERSVFATVVWQRTLFDPEPGPRSPEAFRDTVPVGDHNVRLTGDSRLAGPGRSFTPRLARETGVDYHVVDPYGGVFGVRRQLDELARLGGCDTILLVDVGGDVLATGEEADLKSPLADSMMLAAAGQADARGVVAVTGLGLDGELGAEELVATIDSLREGANTTDRSVPIPADIARRHIDIFRWFPSEVTGLTCLAALGYEGVAEIRTAGLRVPVTRSGATVHLLGLPGVHRHNRLARDLEGTTSFDEAVRIERQSGLSAETEFERTKRETVRRTRNESSDPGLEVLESQLLEYSDRAASEGVTYLTVRRIGELFLLEYDRLMGFLRHLEESYPERLRPPVWLCAGGSGRT